MKAGELIALPSSKLHKLVGEFVIGYE